MSVKKEICEACTLGGKSFPVFGPSFSRRRFFEIAGTGIAGSYLANVVAPPRRLEAATAPPLESSARNLVFVFMNGGPSHSDIWDLKEGAWTPSAFAPATFGSGIRFAQGLMPNIAQHLGRITFLRSALSWAAVHSLAQTWAQQSRNPAGVLGDIAPNIGSVVSLELAAQRKAGDILPGFIALNATPAKGSGYLPARYAPLVATGLSASGLASVKPNNCGGAAAFGERYALLQSLDTDRASGAPLGDLPADMGDFYGQAKALVDSPTVNTYFGWTAADYARYGSTSFGGAALVAKQLLAANQGARYIQLTVGGWDNHANIYAPNGGLFSQMKFFDPAIGSPSATSSPTGRDAGKDALDETLVVMLGEFGRTVGAPNGQGGATTS